MQIIFISILLFRYIFFSTLIHADTGLGSLNLQPGFSSTGLPSSPTLHPHPQLNDGATCSPSIRHQTQTLSSSFASHSNLFTPPSHRKRVHIHTHFLVTKESKIDRARNFLNTPKNQSNQSEHRITHT